MLLPHYHRTLVTLGYPFRWIAAIVAIQIGAVAFEALAVASIIPALEFMGSSKSLDELAATSRGWSLLASAAKWLNVPLGFGMVLAVSFGAIVVRQLFTYLRLVVTADVNNRLIMSLRSRGMRAFLGARLETQLEHASGSLANDLTTEVAGAVSVIGSATSVIGYSIVLLGYVCIVLALSPALSLLAAGIIIVVASILHLIVKNMRAAGKALTRANQEVSAFLIERIGAGRLIRLCRMEAAEAASFDRHLDNQRLMLTRMQRSLALFGVLLEPIALLCGFVLLYIAVTEKIIGFEALILFFFILLRLVPIAKELMLSRQGYISRLASVETLGSRFAQLQAGRERDQGSVTHFDIGSGISLEGISFFYGADRRQPALSDIDILVPARKTTAFVGPSGAGKSTLIDLLLRLRTAQQGRILVGSTPITDFKLATLRAAIAYAPQSPQMFEGSVAQHIRYGKPDATLSEIERAARLAQALPFIRELPGVFDGPIGQNGHRLSGGQRQRLDLARALVSGAPTLLLDEPTASLDAASAQAFHKAIASIRAETDTTVVIVSHDLEAIRDADQIVVLNAGRIEAAGTHEEVLRASPWYASATERTRQGTAKAPAA